MALRNGAQDPDRTQYQDHLDGDVPFWQGQTEGRKDVLITEHIERELELLVFYRREKYEHEGAGFRYEGTFEYAGHKGSSPTNFILRRTHTALSSDVADAPFAVAQLTGRKGNRQGFQITPEARCAVERHAMKTVETYYQEHGWEVDASVAATECFDLLCKRGNSALHVEVKGTTSLGEQIVLTRNEVTHARERYPAIALAVVRNIKILSDDRIRAEGGELTIIEPWLIDDGVLEALAFSYQVPSGTK